MKVIGIDPAPSKKSVIYDGEKFIEKKAVELKEYLDELIESNDNALICWDAPLTGGSPTNFNQEIEKYNPFYQRKIEQLINKEIPKVEGISTLPYAGCSHWAITQHCFGLPLINDEFKPENQTPFKLIPNQDKQEKPFEGKHIVEVHPALALWLWLKDSKVEDWNYKKSPRKSKETSENNPPKSKKDILEELTSKLSDKITKDFSSFEILKIKIKNDDHLDAYVAWLLGTLWLKDEVILVGNKNTGAMLLPNVDDAITLQENLEKYK